MKNSRGTTGTAGRDAWVAGLAGLTAVAGVLGGLPVAVIAVAVAAMPVAGFLLAGHIPGRGAAVGCVGMALAATLIRPEADASPWISLGLLGGVGLVGMIGGSQADRMAVAQGLTTADAGGRWASIIIECDGPAGGVTRTVRPRVSPHPAPERRSLTRLVHERRRGGKPAPSRTI